MKSNPKFDRDYLAALVQLSRVAVTVKGRDGSTHEVPIASINGVAVSDQINAARRAL